MKSYQGFSITEGNPDSMALVAHPPEESSNSWSVSTEHKPSNEFPPTYEDRFRYRRYSQGNEERKGKERGSRRDLEPLWKSKSNCINPSLKSERVTTIKTFQDMRPATVASTSGTKLITYGNKRYLNTRPVCSRSTSSLSPLAQYDNDFSSLFGSETHARIFRTPLRSNSPRFSSGSMAGVAAINKNSRASISEGCRPRRLPDATEIDGSLTTADKMNKHETSVAKVPTSGRKSALRKSTDPSSRSNRSTPVRLRVSFAKTCDTMPASRSKTSADFYGETPSIRLPVLNKSPTGFREELLASPRDSMAERMSTKTESMGEKTKALKNNVTMDCLDKSEASSLAANQNDPGAGQKAMKRTISAKLRVTKRDDVTIPHLRHRREKPTNSISNYTIPSDAAISPKKENIMSLTTDQILVRKSVEKVQRWIETLPRHFSTIHHVLSPVQHDY